MFTYERGEINIKSLCADRDLSNHALGTLVRLHTFKPESSNDAAAIGVTQSATLDLVTIGWAEIQAKYELNPHSGKHAWMRDEIRVLAKKDTRLSVWHITYSQQDAATTHQVMISATTQKQAMEKFRFAWPRHVVRECLCLTMKNITAFEYAIARWALPHGSITLPYAFMDPVKSSLAKRKYAKDSDSEFFEISQLTQTQERDDGDQ